MFINQAGALLRKNLTYQKRRRWETAQVFLFPILFFLLVGFAKKKAEGLEAGAGAGPKTTDNVATPAMETLTVETPPAFVVPNPEFRAVKDDKIPFMDLPDPSCRANASCPTIILITGNDKTFTQNIAGKLFPTTSMQRTVLGLGLDNGTTTQYTIQSRCTGEIEQEPPMGEGLGDDIAECVEVLSLWRNNKAEINEELFKGFGTSNKEGRINEIMAAIDLGDSSSKSFKVNIWYNETFKNTGREENSLASLILPDDGLDSPSTILRASIAQSQSLVSNAYIKSLLGDTADIILEFVGEMPGATGPSAINLNMFLGFISPTMYWLLFLQIFPIILKTVVYDKQQKLRIMMKMHGLGDASYWTISYLYSLLISVLYIALVVGCSMALDLFIVSSNSLAIVIVFFFIFANVQIALAFVFSALFSDVKTVAVVVNTLMVLAVALNFTLVSPIMNQEATPAKYIIILELNPWFGFFRGLMELSQFGEAAKKQGSFGMTVYNLKHSKSGVKEVCIIMLIEWVVFLILALYLDQVVPSGSGVKKHPFFFLKKSAKRKSEFVDFLEAEQSKDDDAQIAKDDVTKEREMVENFMRDPQNQNYSAICYNLKKVYPGEDGNPPKVAVQGLSLVINTGECFGMLGPSGSGKTSFINVMTGLTNPTSADAYVAGLDLRSQMDEIYKNMGICPQHDLLWDILTGREHLLFYGRLKSLKGKTLDHAVEEALKSVKLFDKADIFSGSYSGGMKRRLSVAISLIGNPKIVYLDEPSTGLDPASRNTLWGVIKEAKKNRGILLTTHSMEEAEHLCDRIGIFVDGSLECLGSPEQLKGRYGDTLAFSMTTQPSHDTDVFEFVKRFCPNAERVYHISGTQKFELPKEDIKLSEVFRAVKQAKQLFPIQAWGVSDTSLEDVFIKVATEAQEANLK